MIHIIPNEISNESKLLKPKSNRYYFDLQVNCNNERTIEINNISLVELAKNATKDRENANKLHENTRLINSRFF